METWAIVALVLGSNIIIALSTFFATKMQVRHSDKRLEKELEWTRESDNQKWRREVWGFALLKLRNELGQMTTKLDRLAKSAHTRTLFSTKTEEQAKEELKTAIDDWNNYISGDDLQQVLSLQYDEELKRLVKKIRNDYLESVDYGTIFRKELTAQELGKAARAPEEKIGPEVTKIQSLINKRLEEL